MSALVPVVVYHPGDGARDPRAMAESIVSGAFCTALDDLPEGLREDLVAWCARFEAWHAATFDWQPSWYWEVSDQR